MQPSLMSALAGLIVFGLLSCQAILGTDPHPQVNFKVRSEEGIAYLTCEIPSSMDVVQVTWQKRIGNSYETLVTNSRRFGIKIAKPYEGRLKVLPTKEKGTSEITLSQLENEDGACFMAIFNIYPDGALKGEGCLPKTRGIKEVVCKSSADFSVTLDPPKIKTQHSEPDGTVMQIGRWTSNDISPVCNFQLRRTARPKRSVKDEDEIFCIECNASGPQQPTITWNKEGRPISREEKENRTGDVIMVTSTLHHSLSTLPEESEISCTIAYNKGAKSSHPDISYQEGHGSNSVQEEDLKYKKSFPVRIIILSSVALVFLVVVFFFIAYYFKNGKKSKFPNKVNKIEEGVSTPLTKSTPNCLGTPGTETKKRKESTDENKKNIQKNNTHSTYSPISTKENNVGTPRTETKQRKGSTVKKNKENAAITSNKGTGKSPRSENKEKNSSEQKTRDKRVKKQLFNN